MAFTHTIRPRYAEVDMQGVVFNAHWLTFFDEAVTRFFAAMGFDPKQTWADGGGPFDMMLVKATLEWSGSAGFDDPIEIEVRPDRLGNSSFDVRFVATVEGRKACECVITYVCIPIGEKRSVPMPDELRKPLEAAMA